MCRCLRSSRASVPRRFFSFLLLLCFLFPSLSDTTLLVLRMHNHTPLSGAMHHHPGSTHATLRFTSPHSRFFVCLSIPATPGARNSPLSLALIPFLCRFYASHAPQRRHAPHLNHVTLLFISLHFHFFFFVFLSIPTLYFTAALFFFFFLHCLWCRWASFKGLVVSSNSLFRFLWSDLSALTGKIDKQKTVLLPLLD